MISGREYRSLLGYSNQQKFEKYLKGKDIVNLNWDHINDITERFIDIYENVDKVQKFKANIDIREYVKFIDQQVKDNDIILGLTNRGRPREDVYANLLFGKIGEKVFFNLIKNVMKLDSLEENGDDDFSTPEKFQQTGAADLIDHNNKVAVDVVCGRAKRFDIKLHKFEEAKRILDEGYLSFQFSVDLLNGRYTVTNINNLSEHDFVENASFEGQLCYTVPVDEFKPYV